MYANDVLELQLPSQAAAPARKAFTGSWRLNAGHAITLVARGPALFRVDGGCAWVTFDGPQHGPANDWGDLFLVPGHAVRVEAGQRIVVEALEAAGAARFHWDAATAAAAASMGQRWQVSVGEPLADLRLALHGAAAAALRLVGGVAAFAFAGSGRLSAPSGSPAFPAGAPRAKAAAS
ncbi:DUF2917 domain-containing protein [Ramlibacter sp. H39-3-26]|uniref:DUF2917 domain-containing protein n=1 Tax=Curvibacter soli TaxID=3031331 RepID=UPI0023DC96B2|nr:DUF2917 domain-containing protein [Ramlibacter sp. H39-3-26]MDF1484541.1 DUF2917 domain-containing protein [Ramlibacter sp. H39-3-26]